MSERAFFVALTLVYVPVTAMAQANKKGRTNKQIKIFHHKNIPSLVKGLRLENEPKCITPCAGQVTKVFFSISGGKLNENSKQ